MAATLATLLLAVPLAASGAFSEFEVPKWLVAAIGAALATGLLLRSRRGREDRLVTAAVLVVAGVTVLTSLIVSTSLGLGWTDTMHESVRIFVPLLLCLAAANAGLKGRAAAAVTCAGAFAPAALLAAEVLLQAFPGATEIPHASEHFTATMGNTAHLGELAVLSLPWIGLLAADRRRLLAAAALVPALWIAYRADSRGAWVAGIAMAVIWGLAGLATRDRRPAAARPPWAAACVMVATLALVTVSALQPSGGAYPDAIARAASIADPTHDTNRIRLGLWESGRLMVADNPVLGVGAGNFAAMHPRYRQLEEWSLSGVHSSARDPHCEPVRLLAEQGVGGVLLVVIGLVLLTRTLLRGLLSADASVAAASRCGFAGLTGLVVASLTWATLHHPASVVTSAVLLGVVLDRVRPSVPRAGLGVAVPIAATALAGTAVITACVWAERDAAAVDLRDRAEELKARVAELQLEGPELPSAEIAALGDVGDAMIRVAASPAISFRLRHRLLQTLVNLTEQRQRILAAAESFRADDERHRAVVTELVNAARRLPTPAEVRDALLHARDRAPNHLPTVRLAASFCRADGRIVEAQSLLERALEINADAPLVRVMLAEIYGEAELYERASEQLEGELARYPDAPHADATWEMLARSLGAQGKLLDAMIRVRMWVEHFGDSDRRWAVAGELSLRFGETADTVGLFRADREEIDARAERAAFVRSGLDGTPPAELRTRLLAHLGRHPHDVGVLDRLRDITQQLVRSVGGESEELLRRERKRAIARARVLYAWEHFLDGDGLEMRRCSRIARRINPRQGDAYFLELLPLVEQRRYDEALEVLRRWRGQGFDEFPSLEHTHLFEEFLARKDVRTLLHGSS